MRTHMWIYCAGQRECVVLWTSRTAASVSRRVTWRDLRSRASWGTHFSRTPGAAWLAVAPWICFVLRTNTNLTWLNYIQHTTVYCTHKLQTSNSNIYYSTYWSIPTWQYRCKCVDSGTTCRLGWSRLWAAWPAPAFVLHRDVASWGRLGAAALAPPRCTSSACALKITYQFGYRDTGTAWAPAKILFKRGRGTLI
jgi:hypothetical protein